MAAISSEQALRERYLPAKERAVKKQLSKLDQHCKRFIGLSPFLVLATADAEGNMDASPRGGEPGFVKVIDDHTIIIPDWTGNNRLDTFSNVVATGRVGAIFLVPGVDEAFRVNGAAALRNDEALTSLCEVNGRFPKLVLHVTVKEAYLHCAKAIMRAQLWQSEAQVQRSVLPTMNEMLRDQIGGRYASEPAEPQEVLLARYRTELYSNQ
ncbi:MAG: pyridoxamine 5'-phosphate oxidase family protein [Betaproteobacteria bacterium]|nr:pyridoxamine 5'-phosphate oxidase family protein [Betaproteobacteria bacterium]